MGFRAKGFRGLGFRGFRFWVCCGLGFQGLGSRVGHRVTDVAFGLQQLWVCVWVVVVLSFGAYSILITWLLHLVFCLLPWNVFQV